MAGKDTVIKTLRVEVKADGVLKLAGGLDNVKKKANETSGAIDRTNKGTVGMANSTKNFSKQAQGMGGVVRAYATIAAHVFALSAAFNILKVSADLSSMEKSARSLAATTGINYAGIARSLKDISEGALTFADSMRTANLASSAGIGQGGLERLATIGTKAATVLGRSVPDAINRLVQAVVKGEPELVDEFGIIIRLTTATEAYAESVGKSAKDLSTFEKSQAILNQALKQGEDKFANIEVTAKPYQKLSAEFLDIGQKILEFLSGPVTGIVSLLANNSSLIVAAIIGISTALIKLAIPAVSELGNTFTSKLAVGITESTARLDALKKKGLELKNSLKGSDAYQTRNAGGAGVRQALTDDPSLIKKVSKTNRSAISKAITGGANDADLAKAMNTTMKPYIVQLRKQTKEAIEQGAKTVNLRGNQISTDQAQAILKNAETFKAATTRAIAEGTKTGFQRGVVHVQAFAARFRATTVRMGQELAMGLQAGLSATSFAAFRANMTSVLASGTLTSKLAVGLGSVAAAGKAAFGAFTKLLPVAAIIGIAWSGFKAIATAVGALTPAYDKFNSSIKESNKLLEEQESIQKDVINARKTDSKADTLAGQIKFIDALVNSYSTLESAADKLIDAANAFDDMSWLDKLLTWGDEVDLVLKSIAKLNKQSLLTTGTSLFETEAGKGLEGTTREDLVKEVPRKIFFSQQRLDRDPKAREVFDTRNAKIAKIEKENLEARFKVVTKLKLSMEQAAKPIRELQGNFKAIEESSREIGSNIAAVGLEAGRISKASKPLRDISIGLAAIDKIDIKDITSGTESLDRAAAAKSFIESLSTNAQRYFGILDDGLNVEVALSKVRAEQVRLTKKVNSDLADKTRIEALTSELEIQKTQSDIYSANTSLISARRDNEVEILSIKESIARSDRAELVKLRDIALAGSAEKAGLISKIKSETLLLKNLGLQKKTLKGVAEEREKSEVILERQLAIVTGISSATKADLSIAEAINKTNDRNTLNRAKALSDTRDLFAAVSIQQSTEVLLAKNRVTAATKQLRLAKETVKEQNKGITPVVQTTLEIKAQNELLDANLAARLAILDQAEALYQAEEKVFEARKDASSFSVFGSLEQNAEAISLFKEAIGREITRFSRGMTNDTDRMVSALTETSDAFTDKLVDGFSGDTPIIQSIKDAFVAGAETLHETLQGFLKEDLKEGTRKLFGDILGIDTSTTEEKALLEAKVHTELLREIAGLGPKVPAADAPLENVKKTENLFTSMGTKLKDTFLTTWDKIKSIFGGLWESLGRVFTSIFNMFDGGGGGKGGILGTLVSAAITGIAGMSTGTAGITSASGATSFALSDVARATELPFPQLAKGGIATKPSIAGEGSMNEAVIPLPDGRSVPVSMSGGKGDVSIVINVDVESGTASTETQGDDKDYKQLGKMISNAVKSEIMNQKRPGGLLA